MDYLTGVSPFGSTGTLLIVFLVAVFVLYVARETAHIFLRGLFGMLYTGFRMGAAAAKRSQQRLAERNRDVLLNLGKEQAARELEKEFFEVSKFVQRDLGGYPQLQRQIQEQITQIQSDHERSKEVPISAPEWIKAVESISKIKGGEGSHNVGSKVLEQIHQSADQQHKENLKNYREVSSQRHKILNSMTPFWRKLAGSVDETGVRLKEIITRSQNIDAQMVHFDEIVQGSEKAERTLKASAATQFIIAALVIAVATGGAFFNFHLIALPMSEMVGSLQRIGGVKVSDLAALVIICLEMTAGIFLLECLRITKLFPLIGSMDDRIRRTILIVSAVVLFTLASTEAALAFMRDQIAGDLSALRASLSGTAVSEITSGGINEWIPMTANMVLGFILPLALTMVAIPLEYLLQTGRTVLGGLLEIVLNLLVVLLRILAIGARHLGKVAISLYDFSIAAPLWIEGLIKGKRGSPGEIDDFYSADSFEESAVAARAKK